MAASELSKVSETVRAVKRMGSDRLGQVKLHPSNFKRKGFAATKLIQH